MSRKLIRPRRLVIDADTVCVWTVRRHHGTGDRRHTADCRTVLSLWREGTKSRLGIVFSQAEGRIIADGYLDAGTVGDSSAHRWLNLYEPGVVRRFADEAAARGLLPAAGSAPGSREVDGWPLFDAVMAGSEAHDAAPAARTDG
ncbi:hypothetical protein ACFYT4_00595 [Streptomyces sp. NPDC004609]|uniref:hypothetical protein n=1 Tax=Streptomyces sp. NPDC004609 TaxID=3364704 RepID=UPI00367994E6